MVGQPSPRLAFVPRVVDLPRLRPDVQPRRILTVGRQRVPQDGEPGALLRQPLGQRLPRAPAVVRTVHGHAPLLRDPVVVPLERHEQRAGQSRVRVDLEVRV